jgi:hypothetical protein
MVKIFTSPVTTVVTLIVYCDLSFMVRHITTDFDLMQAEILIFLQKKSPTVSSEGF